MRPRRALMRWVLDYFIEHWFISAVISTSPTFIFGLMKLFSSQIETPEGTIKPIAFWLLVPATILSLFFTTIKSAAVNFDSRAKSHGQDVLEQMLDFANILTNHKSTRFLEYIEHNHGKTHSELAPFVTITQPRRQISEICSALRKSVRDIFGIALEDIGVSLIYRPKSDSKWEALHWEGVDGDLSLRRVVEGTDTAFRAVSQGNRSRLFFPSKIDAINAGHFVPSERDKNNRNEGSVFCQRITISDNVDESACAVLTITTYGTLLCSSNDHDSIRKIEAFVIPAAIYRLALELRLLYIKETMCNLRK